MEKFEFYIGNTYSRDFTIKKYTDDIDEIYFTVKKADDDKKPLIQKTLDNGITLTDIEYDTDGTTILSRTYNLLINADDTEGLKPEIEYNFDIEIITNKQDANIENTIIKGVLVLHSATTRKWNEV